MPEVLGIVSGTGLQTLGTAYTNFGDDPTDTGQSSSSLTSVFTSGINLGGVLYSTAYINNNGAVTFSEATDRNGWGNYAGNSGYTVRAKGYSGDGVVSLGLLWADYHTGSSTANGGPGSVNGTGFGTNTIYFGINQDSDAIAYTWDDVVRYGGSGASDVNAQILLERVGESDANITYTYESANYYYRNSGDGIDCAFGLNLSLGDDNALWNLVDYLDLQDQDMVNNLGNTGTAGIFQFSIRDGYITNYATGTSDKPVVSSQTIAWGSNIANAAAGTLLGYIDASDNVQVLAGRFVYSTGYKSLTSEDGYFSLNSSNGEVRFTAAGASAFNALQVGSTLTSSVSIQVLDNENNVSIPGPVSLLVKRDNGVGPVLVSAATNSSGAKIILKFDESLSSIAASSSDFEVLVAGSVVNVSNVVVRDRVVELILAGNIGAGQVVSVSYDDPSGADDPNAVQDSAGNDASSFVNVLAANRVSPRDPQRKSKNYQLTDHDEDGLIELVSTKDGLIVDVNRDGTPDSLQRDVVGIRLIKKGSRNSDYGGIEVLPSCNPTSAYIYTRNSFGYKYVEDRGGAFASVSPLRGQKVGFAGTFLFSVDGLASGASTQITLHLPTGLKRKMNSYVMYNYADNRYEEYLDSIGNPLYSYVDLDGNGAIDAIVLDIIDGSQKWDRDGLANGEFLCLGYAAYDKVRPSLLSRLDAVTGQRVEDGGGSNHLERNPVSLNLVPGDLLETRDRESQVAGEAADLITGSSIGRIFSYSSFEESMPGSSDTLVCNVHDRFDFRSFDGDTTRGGRQALRFVGSQMFSGIPGELRAANSHLQADVNGDSIADFSVIIDGSMPLSANNFLL